ncbi:uncharacterized protein TNCV_496331 [Trichonephila clavipes]|nr:uncharacterized protein TNCV_496331 [Trichonephila clavipes]
MDTKSCKDCAVVLEELERIDDDAGNFGVAFVKNSEKSTAKKYGVTSFPALMYFRNQQPAIFDGDLKDEEKVLAWLTDLDSMELPDKIEEVNAKILENLIEDSDYLAVLLFYSLDFEDLINSINIDDLINIHWCAKIKDGVEKLAYQLNEEAERTERPIRRLSKVMYGSTCADMQVDVMGECLSSKKHVVGVRSVFLAKRLHAV